jgi:tRNA threonylcarbamoyladenosine biosynthesis protein TsaB
MITLALDTSTEAFSVALHCSKGLSEHFEIAPREHGDKLLPAIDKLLNDAEVSMKQVSQIVYGRGPGAFTGVRISISAAQGLAMGAGCSMVGISSLQNLALQAFQKCEAEIAVVAMDARMGEVYFAAFRADRSLSDGRIWPKIILEEQVIAPDRLNPMNIGSSETVVAIGSGWSVYGDTLKNSLSISPQHLVTHAFPRASSAIALAQFEQLQKQAHEPEQAVPVYLRNQVAKKSRNQAN